MELAQTTESQTRLSPLEYLCYRLSILRLSKAHAVNPASFREDQYQVWREEEMRRELACFDKHDIEGRRVMDFGCGYGQLCFLVERMGAAAVLGVDINAHRIEMATAENARRQGACRFVLAHEESARMEIPAQSADTILCFDVLEHIINYREVFREWRRVLAPGGKVLIDWTPWTHPYAHHLWTLLPLPWVHLAMSDRALMRVCARVYDHPAFRPRFFHFDENGNRRENPYRGTGIHDLNQLTVGRFEREAREAGFRVARKTVYPFAGSPASVKRMLAASSLFVAHIAYELM